MAIRILLILCAAAFGQQLVDVPIMPGGMASDIVTNGMAAYQHQQVWNLRQNKLGEWESVPGIYYINEDIDSLQNAMEITDDVTGDRFIIYHAGHSIYRMDYDDGYGNSTPEAITLPDSVTIEPTSNILFMWYRGVLRIMGGSDPIWYSYINRVWFSTAGDSAFADFGWKAEKTNVSNAVNLDVMPFVATTGRNSYTYYVGFVTSYPTPKTWKIYYFAIYDGGQYALPNTDDILYWMNTSHNSLIPCLGCDPENLNLVHTVYRLGIKVNELRSAWPNDRVTGVGIVMQDPNGIRYCPHFISFIDSLPAITYTRYARVASTYTLELSYEDNQTHVMKEDGYLYKGENISLSTTSGNVNCTIDSVVWDGTLNDKRMKVICNASLAALSAATYKDVTITCHRNWVYDSGYITAIPIDLTTESTEYYGFTGIPAGTSSIEANYRGAEIVGERLYALSNETQEEDAIRFSPPFQYDVLPTTNIIQTRVGDRDRNLAICNRDDRIVILKQNSIEQGQYSGDGYYRDVAFAGHGLYAKRGYMLLDNYLYVMDRDDIYRFDGASFQPFMTGTEMRNYYQDHVDTLSFMAYDRLNREIICVLDTVIIVYQTDKGQWWERRTELEPICAFQDFDQRLIFCSSDSMGTFNQDSTSSEEINFGFKTRVINTGSPERLRQLLYLYFFTQGNDTLDVTIKDDGQTRTYTDSVAMTASRMAMTLLRPKYWHNEFYMTVQNRPLAAKNDFAQIRRTLAKIWVSN